VARAEGLIVVGGVESHGILSVVHWFICPRRQLGLGKLVWLKLQVWWGLQDQQAMLAISGPGWRP
jgi:hypothetical protein